MYEYAVGIPTRGRTAILRRTLEAFLAQAEPPKLILVVDNNDERLPPEVFPDSEIIKAVPRSYKVPGIIQGDQTALEYFDEYGFKLAARWDDDLIPEPDCMGKLLRWTRVSLAVGGMYPGVERDRRGLRSNAMGSGDGNPRHLQFFRWDGTEKSIARHFLYSSFVYSVPHANLIGGFCTDYSQHSYRADTDFTLRLNKVADKYKEKNLIVVPDAVAMHHFGEGGTRDIVGEEKDAMLKHDLALFDQRMRSMGIDPEY